MTIQEFAARFGSVKPRVNGSYQVKCPCHDDNEASLTISEGKDGKVVLHCHAGCDTEGILRAKGLTYADLSANGKPQIKVTYDYRDASGNLVYQAVRFEPKAFKQRRPDPDGKDGWIWSTKDIEPLPYRLPELLKAIGEGRTIYIAEGEKDVDNLWKIGIPATTNHGGAGKWRDTHSQYLKGADVVILPDNDEAGRDHAVKVSASLKGLARQVRVLELPKLSTKGDVSEWIGLGGTPDQLSTLASNAPTADEWRAPDPAVSTFKLYTVDELLNLPPITWLMPGKIPAGALIMLFGRSGVGKSFLALDIALNIGQNGVVVYIAAEGLHGYPDRIMAWGRYFHKEYRNLRLTREPLPIEGAGLTAFVEAIKPLKPILVVVDTVARCMVGYDENSQKDMGLFIAACDMIRRVTGAATLVVHHTGKDGADARGSSALRAACDTVIKVDSDGNLMTITNEKMKDADEFAPYQLRRIVAEAREGQTSCVLMPSEAAPQTENDPLSVNQRNALTCLLEYGAEGTTWSNVSRWTGLKDNGLSTVLRTLGHLGLVTEHGKKGSKGRRYSITPKGATAIGQALPESQGDLFDPAIGAEHQRQRSAAEPFHIKDTRIELTTYLSGDALDQAERYAKGENVTNERALQIAVDSVPPDVWYRVEATRRECLGEVVQIVTTDGATITASFDKPVAKPRRPAPIY